jgi:hypothetical protein
MAGRHSNFSYYCACHERCEGDRRIFCCRNLAPHSYDHLYAGANMFRNTEFNPEFNWTEYTGQTCRCGRLYSHLFLPRCPRRRSRGLGWTDIHFGPATSKAIDVQYSSSGACAVRFPHLHCFII